MRTANLLACASGCTSLIFLLAGLAAVALLFWGLAAALVTVGLLSFLRTGRFE